MTPQAKHDLVHQILREMHQFAQDLVPNHIIEHWPSDLHVEPEALLRLIVDRVEAALAHIQWLNDEMQSPEANAVEIAKKGQRAVEEFLHHISDKIQLRERHLGDKAVGPELLIVQYQAELEEISKHFWRMLDERINA